MTNSKIHTFVTDRETGIHRLNVSTIVNIDKDSANSDSDTLWEVDNLIGVTRYTTVAEAITNGNLIPISAGGGSLTVRDEGIEIDPSVTCMNFIGADVQATPDVPGCVNIFIPTPQFPSHYNTVDGNTTGTVPDVSTDSRYISIPTSGRGPLPGEFNTGAWESDTTSRPCTRTGVLNFNNTQDILLDDELSTLTAQVIDTDGTIISENIVNPVNGNSTSTVQNITTVVSNYGPTGPKFKARFNIQFNLGAIIPNGGRVIIKIIHFSDSNYYIKTQELFYDSESNTAALTGVTLQENNPSRIIKYLSGVKYYDLNSPFIVDIADIDFLNGDSHPRNKGYLSSNMGLSPYYLHSGTSNITSWTNDWNNENCTHHNDNWTITATDYCFTSDAIISANTIDWTNGPTVTSTAYPVLINTWTPQSDELSEYFLDEDFRLLQDFTTPWDSTQDLATYDGPDNSVQVMCGRIKVPGTSSPANNNNPDFSTRNPLTNPDYTGLTGKRYYRKFTDVTNSTRSSCNIHIEGFTLQDLKDNKIEMWINIPGRFITHCPVHSTSEYNFGTIDFDLGTGSNGPYPTGASTAHYDDAIRVNSSTSNDIAISFGGVGLDSSHNFFEVELIINDSTIEPEQMVVSW